MEENPQETKNIPDTGDRLPRIPLIVAISLVFTVAVVVSLWSMKVFSPLAIKRAALPPERPDPLGKALTVAAHGFTNAQLVGKTYYEKYCKVCHGDSGKGDGFNAFNLDPRPRDLTEELLGRERLLTTISTGFVGTDGSLHCPPWGITMGKDEISSTISYVRALAKPSPE